MINKNFEDITIDDIILLKENEIPESKTIEYKIKYFNDNADDKKEFLADISSFANTEGGDLIFGINAIEGIPSNIEGVSIENNDSFMLQCNNLIRDGIAPRIKFDCKIIDFNDKKVVIFRIYKSWNKPHRVEYKSYHRFYARHSTGKYPLDVEELRNIFISSELINDKINNFINFRNNDILSNDTFLPLVGNGKLVLYLLPIESFVSKKNYDIFNLKNQLSPIKSSGTNFRINLEGYLSYSSANNRTDTYSYVQLYRNGIIEAVNSSLLGFNEKKKTIPSIAYEREIINGLSNYINIYKILEIEPPIIIYLNFINIKGYSLAYKQDFYDPDEIITYPKDILKLPGIMLLDYDIDIPKFLKSTFDLVWNTFGFPRSLNYNEQDEWIERS